MAKRRLPWYGWVGLGILLAGQLGLVLEILPVQVAFYFIAWWSYILVVDAWVWRRRGWSLLRDRPWEFLVLAFWSVAVWSLFEAFNFRLQNWFYVNVPARFPLGFLPSCLAYATVLPGLFETYDLLRVEGVAARLSTRPWHIRRAGLVLAVGSGLGMLAAPLLWPRYAFPLVWGFAVFLLDPVCYLAGPSRGTSLLAQLERGDPRPFLRLLLAGLLCGGLWEFWNFWAVTKWLYTVPFFEEWKWFEMPILGFLGFPPFAVECYVLVNVLNLCRRGRGWEEPDQTGAGATAPLAVAAVAAAVAFTFVVYAGIDRWTVQSSLPTLAEMDGLPPEVRQRLAGVGVRFPQGLLQRTARPEDLTALARRAGVPEDHLREARAAARLVTLAGLGVAHAGRLRSLGISRVEELAREDPGALARRWSQSAGQRAPSPPQIRIWIRAARRESGLGSP